MGADKQRYCICRSTDSKSFMIGCDNCEEWFHGRCIKINPEKASTIRRYYCGDCTRTNPALKIKYKKDKSKEKRKHDKKDEPAAKKPKKSAPSTPKPSSALLADDRHCMECDNCKTTEDCGSCDFCKDMKKNGGANKFKQDCRQRQCKKLGIKTDDVRFLGDDSETVTSPVPPPPPPKPKKPAPPKQKRPPKKATPKAPKPRKPYTRKSTDENKTKPVVTNAPRQCMGPRCVNPGRPESKYCSDECGMKLAAMRLVEIMPRRIAQWQSSPCVAEQKNRKELEEVRDKILEAKKHLESLDEKHRVIDRIVEKGKKEKVKEEDSDEESKSDDEEEEEEMELFIYCVTCGLEVKQRSAFKHMERCFVKIERDMSFAGSFKSMIGGDTICDHFNVSTKSYCKRLKVICAEHAKDPKIADDEICGCPLTRDVFDETGDLCKTAKKHCNNHFRWERMRRAEIDADKVRQWMKIDELFERERHIRTAMANRAGVMSLLLHQTVDHDALAASHHKIHTPLKSETRAPQTKNIPTTVNAARNLSHQISSGGESASEEPAAGTSNIPLSVGAVSPPGPTSTLPIAAQKPPQPSTHVIRLPVQTPPRQSTPVRIHSTVRAPHGHTLTPGRPQGPMVAGRAIINVRQPTPLTLNTIPRVIVPSNQIQQIINPRSATESLINIAKQQVAAAGSTPLQINRSISTPATSTPTGEIRNIVLKPATASPTTIQPQIVHITKQGVVRAGNRTPMLQNLIKTPGATITRPGIRPIRPHAQMIIKAPPTTNAGRTIVQGAKAPITIFTVKPGQTTITPLTTSQQQQHTAAAPGSDHDYSYKK